MGVEQSVTFAGGSVPAWPAVRVLLEARAYPVQMRMIDGQLAFPDEEPPEAWRELRLGTPGGMITLRRDGSRVAAVVWGNADRATLQGRDLLLWAFAAAGDGRVVTETGELSADDFRARADLPAG
jgi:hypothetical protein